MINFNWDVVEQVCRETGRAVMLGVWSDFDVHDKRKMDAEAKKRGLNLTMGNSKRSPDEEDDELYAMAKL